MVREEPDAPPKRLGVLGPGTSFGEIALLKDTVRTATVRCLTPVNVVKVSRRDFATLVKSHAVFRGVVEQAAKGLLEKDAERK